MNEKEIIVRVRSKPVWVSRKIDLDGVSVYKAILTRQLEPVPEVNAMLKEAKESYNELAGRRQAEFVEALLSLRVYIMELQLLGWESVLLKIDGFIAKHRKGGEVI